MCRDFRWDDARRQLAGLPQGGLNIAFEAVERHAARTARPEDGSPVAWPGWRRAGHDFRRARASLESFCQRARFAGRGPRRRGVLAPSTDSGRLRLHAGGVEGRGGGVALVLRVRTRARCHAAEHRPRHGARDHTGAVPAQGGADPRAGADAEARAAGQAARGPRGAGALPADTRDLDEPDGEGVRRFRPSCRQGPRIRRCCTSPAAPPASRRARCTCTTPWSPTGPRARYALDLHDDDIFWCTADPGWVTGMSYGVIAPLLHGVTMIVDEAEFDAERWYRILAASAKSPSGTPRRPRSAC